jgi:hypothetical protein
MGKYPNCGKYYDYLSGFETIKFSEGKFLICPFCITKHGGWEKQ